MLEITDVKIFHTRNKTAPLKATCTVTFNDVLSVLGVKIKENAHGFYISFPMTEDKHPIVYPTSGELRKEIADKIISEYMDQVDSIVNPLESHEISH